MNPLEIAFKRDSAFVGFLTAGDGGVDYTVECALALIAGGVTVLEIGFPFSDPVADGPVIQRASQRSLETGTTATTLLEVGRRIRERSDTPLVLFTYYNPLLRQGDDYLKELKKAGFNGVLVVDLPAPDSDRHPYYCALIESGLQPIFVVTPSTDDQRLQRIADLSQGFIYYACQKGTTGVRDKLPEDFQHHIARIRRCTGVPIAAGFGIANRESATAALAAADGFVVGSAFVALMELRVCPTNLKSLAESIRP